MNILKKFEILTYNVGFVNKTIEDVLNKGINKNEIIWMKHNYKDRFFADPFLLKEDSDYYYILCEEFVFWEEKGKISLLIVRKDNYKLCDKKILIEENYHLSFPACFKNGNVVKPEASKSNKYFEYIIDTEKFVVLDKFEILNEGTIDAIEFDYKNETFLLTGKINNPSGELYIYKCKNGKYKPNDNAPVVSDKSCSRNAGNIFKYKNDYYRPVQDCTEKYGKQTKIMKIKKFGEKVYVAEEIKVVNSYENPPYNETLHTFNVYDNFVLIDGSKSMFRFPMKIFYKKFRFIFRLFKNN